MTRFFEGDHVKTKEPSDFPYMVVKHVSHGLHVLQGFIDKVKGLAKGGLLRVKDVEAFAEKHVDDLSVEQDNVPDPPLTCEEKEAEAAQ